VIGIDTNVLVRAFRADEPEQADAAEECLTRECSEAVPGFVNLVVLCEFVWVMTRTYKVSRAEMVETVARMLSTAELAVERPEVAAEALGLFRAGAADFADCVIAATNARAGCAYTRSFDKTAAVALPQFRLVGR
jgi:predicted nucleic-acid-binding protein